MKAARIALVVMGLAVCPFSVLAADTQRVISVGPTKVIVQAQVVELSIVRNTNPKMRIVVHVMNDIPGTSIVAAFSLQNALIVTTSKPVVLTQFADDLATDLESGTPGKEYRPSMQAGNSPSLRIAPDRTSFDLRLHSRGIPASGAAAITVKGVLPARLGFGEKTEVVENQSLKLGKSFDVGGLQLTVQSISLTGNKKDQSLRLISDKSLEPIRSITLSDAKGRQLSTRVVYPTAGNRRSISITVPGVTAGATLAVTFFERVVDVDIPFELKVDLKK